MISHSSKVAEAIKLAEEIEEYNKNSKNVYVFEVIHEAQDDNDNYWWTTVTLSPDLKLLSISDPGDNDYYLHLIEGNLAEANFKQQVLLPLLSKKEKAVSLSGNTWALDKESAVEKVKSNLDNHPDEISLLLQQVSDQGPM